MQTVTRKVFGGGVPANAASITQVLPLPNTITRRLALDIVTATGGGTGGTQVVDIQIARVLKDETPASGDWSTVKSTANITSATHTLLDQDWDAIANPYHCRIQVRNTDAAPATNYRAIEINANVSFGSGL